MSTFEEVDGVLQRRSVRIAQKIPFTLAEREQLERDMAKQYEKEKEDGEIMGQTLCLLTGEMVPFCPCAPHLFCPEHTLNCQMNGSWDWNDSKNDSLLVRYAKFRARRFLE